MLPIPVDAETKMINRQHEALVAIENLRFAVADGFPLHALRRRRSEVDRAVVLYEGARAEAGKP